jgi:transposase
VIEPVVKCCAGLDVHRASVVGTVLEEDDEGQVRKETREYGAFRKSLVELGGWLRKRGVELAVMESTGVF